MLSVIECRIRFSSTLRMKSSADSFSSMVIAKNASSSCYLVSPNFSSTTFLKPVQSIKGLSRTASQAGNPSIRGAITEIWALPKSCAWMWGANAFMARSPRIQKVDKSYYIGNLSWVLRACPIASTKSRSILRLRPLARSDTDNY